MFLGISQCDRTNAIEQHTEPSPVLYFLAGMRFCADLYTNGSLTDSCIFPYFDKFVTWYDENYVKDSNGYAVWWNHILYASANNDDLAFDSFFHYFGLYLREQHEIVFPLDIT